MNEPAVDIAMGNRALSKASQVLTGIVTGVVADGQLHDLEIQMLSTWLSANQAVAETWPGFAIARLIREVLADGHISAEERQHLLTELQAMVGNDFSDTGAVESEVASLPFDLAPPPFPTGARLCLTGTFLYGTRNACEKLATQAGFETATSVSKRVHALVVGTHVSPDWVSTSYGLKIIRAMELRNEGHNIRIVRERDWLSTLQPT